MSHFLCGLRVVSDLPLPDLAPWTGEDRPADIEIRLGDVPDRLPEPVFEGPLLQVAADGTCRFAMEGVAAFLVEGGRRITVRPLMPEDAPDIRVFLLGSVFGFLCHQRGLLPLHAGCVEIGGKAVAFAGPSGVGKSTLTAAFLRRGYRVLADDVTVIDPDAAGGPQAWPSFPRVKLWADAVEGMGFDADGLERARFQLEKYHVPTTAGFRPDPLPLAGLYHLHRVNDARLTGLEPLGGTAAAAAAFEAVYRQQAALRMGRREALMNAALRLAAVPAFRLGRIKDMARLDGMVDAILARHAP